MRFIKVIMSDSTCPFVLTKGTRKGQVCGAKSKSRDIVYCRTHLRNVGVQQELVDKGVDIDTVVKNPIVSNIDTPPSSTNKNSIRPINSSYAPPIIKSSKIKDVAKQEEDSAFITAFSKSLDDKLAADSVDMDDIYEDFNEEDDNIDQSDHHISSPDDNPEMIAMKRELEHLRQQKAAAERRIMSMFTMKQVLFVGIKTVSEIAEHMSDNLNGYTDDIIRSDQVNAILDEMADDLNVITGFSDQPAYIRLGITMAAIGSTTLLRNQSGVRVREPNLPTPVVAPPIDIPISSDEKFTPPYKD